MYTKEKGIYFKCGKTGHLSKNCNQRIQVTIGVAENQNSDNDDGNDCFKIDEEKFCEINAIEKVGVTFNSDKIIELKVGARINETGV